MEGKELKLQPRLACIASCVPAGARLADVGTDHGYLPVFLLQRGKIMSAIASDLRSEPLAHAKRTAQEYGVFEKIDFRLCSGLDAIEPGEVDTVVIAGMGGELIIKLLDAAKWTREQPLTLILQPQTKTELLRSWLCKNGYRFTGEKLVRDKGTLYAVLLVTAGESAPLSEEDAYGGVMLENDALYGEYILERVSKLARAVEGMKSAKECDGAALAQQVALLEKLKKKKGEWEDANCR